MKDEASIESVDAGYEEFLLFLQSPSPGTNKSLDAENANASPFMLKKELDVDIMTDKPLEDVSNCYTMPLAVRTFEDSTDEIVARSSSPEPPQELEIVESVSKKLIESESSEEITSGSQRSQPAKEAQIGVDSDKLVKATKGDLGKDEPANLRYLNPEPLCSVEAEEACSDNATQTSKVELVEAEAVLESRPDVVNKVGLGEVVPIELVSAAAVTTNVERYMGEDEMNTSTEKVGKSVTVVDINIPPGVDIKEENAAYLQSLLEKKEKLRLQKNEFNERLNASREKSQNSSPIPATVPEPRVADNSNTIKVLSAAAIGAAAVKSISENETKADVDKTQFKDTPNETYNAHLLGGVESSENSSNNMPLASLLMGEVMKDDCNLQCKAVAEPSQDYEKVVATGSFISEPVIKSTTFDEAGDLSKPAIRIVVKSSSPRPSRNEESEEIDAAEPVGQAAIGAIPAKTPSPTPFHHVEACGDHVLSPISNIYFADAELGEEDLAISNIHFDAELGEEDVIELSVVSTPPGHTESDNGPIQSPVSSTVTFSDLDEDESVQSMSNSSRCSRQVYLQT